MKCLFLHVPEKCLKAILDEIFKEWKLVVRPTGIGTEIK